MMTKQTFVALALLIGGIALFGLLSARTAPIAAPQETRLTVAGEYAEDGEYFSIRIFYTEASPAVRAAIEADMQEVVAAFKSNTKVESLTPEDILIQNLGGERKYTLAAEYEARTSPGYTSYAYIVYEDTLGAHPNGNFKTFVFDTAGNRVSLTEIVGQNPNWLAELSRRVTEDVSAQYRDRTQAEDSTGQLFLEGLAPKEENFKSFVLDQDTLVILIPPYQAAAYAIGPFEVRVPLSDLK